MNFFLTFSALAECLFAFNSTRNLDITRNQGLPDNLHYWGIASTRGCLHLIHIDGAGLNTRMRSVSGYKLFLIGVPKSPSTFSWNPRKGHTLSNILDKLHWQLVVIPPGSELYVPLAPSFYLNFLNDCFHHEASCAQTHPILLSLFL